MEDKFDGFTVNLYLDEEGDWIAHFLELLLENAESVARIISRQAEQFQQALMQIAHNRR